MLDTFKALLVFTTLTAAIVTGVGQADEPRGTQRQSHAAAFRLVFSDDFNGRAGSAPNSHRWKHSTGTGFGNGEIERMTSSRRNVSLDGHGRLLITPVRQRDGSWTSGRIKTRSAISAPNHGVLRVEASIQLPQGQNLTGYWPAFWLLGVGSWPKAGELDLMENINGGNTVYSTFHCGTFPGGPCQEHSGIGVQTDLSSRAMFHAYRVDLDKSANVPEIRFYIDRKLVGKIESNSLPRSVWRAATQRLNVIFDLAIGGWWPGNPAADSTVGAPMKIAYVAVYRKGEAG